MEQEQADPLLRGELESKSGRQLGELLHERGLKVTGTKDAKVNRLLKNWNGPAQQDLEPKISKTHPIYCLVPECHSHTLQDGIKLHRIPAGRARRTVRRIWIRKLKNIRANLILSEGTRICSKHFKPEDYNEAGGLDPDSIPSIFPTKQNPPKPSRKRPRDRSEVDRERVANEPSDHTEMSTSSTAEEFTFLAEEAGSLCPKCQESRSVADFSCQVNLSDINVDDLGNDDKKTRFFTGFPNYGTFLLILTTLIAHGKDRLNYWGRKNTQKEKPYHSDPNAQKGGSDRKLCLPAEFLMTMIWYRLGLVEDHLAAIFKVSKSNVSRILTTWTQFIFEYSSAFVTLPSPQNVLNNMPRHFVNHQTVYIVYDCTEFFMEKPSSLEAQNLTWSEYKHHNTIKVLIGVAPDGLVTFVSPSWGGRASDRHIVIKEKALSFIPAGMSVMADKGFQVEDLLPPGVKLITPPKVSSKGQMTDYEFFKTVEVAEPRIVVEMKMEQAKNFHLLQNVFPISRIATAHQAIYNAFAFTNLLPQLFVTENCSETLDIPIYN